MYSNVSCHVLQCVWSPKLCLSLPLSLSLPFSLSLPLSLLLFFSVSLSVPILLFFLISLFLSLALTSFIFMDIGLLCQREQSVVTRWLILSSFSPLFPPFFSMQMSGVVETQPDCHLIFRTGWNVCCSFMHCLHWLRCVLQCVAVAHVTCLISIEKRVAVHEMRVSVWICYDCQRILVLITNLSSSALFSGYNYIAFFSATRTTFRFQMLAFWLIKSSSLSISHN